MESVISVISAYAFIDFLYDAGQTSGSVATPVRQVSAIHPIRLFSLRGQPLLISPDLLLKDNLLEKDDLADVPVFNDYSC